MTPVLAIMAGLAVFALWIIFVQIACRLCAFNDTDADDEE